MFASYSFAEAKINTDLSYRTLRELRERGSVLFFVRFRLFPLQSSFGALIFIIGALPSGVCLQTYPLYRFSLDHGPVCRIPMRTVLVIKTFRFRFVFVSVLRDL